jgi:uncharacterized protein YbcV (DUF1398 family)
MNIEEVQRISKVSKQQKWPYPRTFQELLAAGVQYYEVNMSNRTINYTSGQPGQSYEESIPVFDEV